MRPTERQRGLTRGGWRLLAAFGWLWRARERRPRMRLLSWEVELAHQAMNRAFG